MPQTVEVPGLGNVEFPDGMSKQAMSAAIRSALVKKGGQLQEQPITGAGFEGFAPGSEVGPEVPAFLLRTAPGLIPNPLLSMPISGAGEAGAQLLESGQITSPGQIALATAVPPAAAAVGRLGRGLMRTGTRLIPSFFEKAQRTAGEAGEALVQGLRPAEDVAALARSARAAGTDLIPATNIQRVLGEIKLPATPANPRLAQVKTTIDNLKAVLKPAGQIDLADLEAIRRDIGPLLQSKGAPSELRGIYGAIVTDLEKEAAAGGVGASLARETAKAFKQDLGAAKVVQMLETATTFRVISGGNVPALDIGKFSKLLSDAKTKKQLLDQIGPDAFRTVEEFATRFRALPPTVAYSGWNSLISVLSGGAGGLAGGIPGAAVGVLAPEVIKNMALVGANPQALNVVMISVAQGIRAASVTAVPPSRRGNP